MKIKGAKAVHYESGPNMTPLVDVVMVILIFLMLTGSFGATSHFLPSSMPIKEKGKGQIDPTKIPKVPDPTLEIFISTVGDSFKAKLGPNEGYTDAESLAAALTKRREQHVASGSTPDKMQILLSPRLSTKFSHIMEVYEAAMKAEWPKIGFQSAKD
jgi:biopolymer transport protein ExbD